MGTCDEIFELLSAALDGELTPEKQTALDAHLACCSVCSALYEELRDLRAAMTDLPELTAPEGFSARVMDAVAADSTQEQTDNVVPFPARRRSAGVWKRWGACAAAVAVVALGAIAAPGLLPGGEKLAADDAQNSAVSAYSTADQEGACAADAAEAAEDTAPQYAWSEPSFGTSVEDSSEADSNGADLTELERKADHAGCPVGDQPCCGVLTVSSGELPENIGEYESFLQDGVRYYLLPAADFYELTLQLGLSTEAWDADAEYGLVAVEFTES